MGNEASILGGEAYVPESLNEALQQIMNERGIYPRSVPDGLSHQNVRGHGKAVCTNSICRRRWTSYQVSGEVNLKQQRVTKVWKQKCKECNMAVTPEFRENEFKDAVDNMLDRYKAKLHGDRPSVWDDVGSGPPHLKELCEGCGYGTGDCRARRAGSSNYGGTTSNESSGMSGAGMFALGAAGLGLLGLSLYAAFNKPDDDDKRGAGAKK